MTVVILFDCPDRIKGAGSRQVEMAIEIESDYNFPASEIRRQRRDNGGTFAVLIETGLPSQSIENMVPDILKYLPDSATHIETREV